MLYVVPTPIGNLEDITLRALKTLENADLIAAEDTRHTLGLLEHFGIKKPVVSYYEHNKIARGPELIGKLEEGADIALVSDAGMPGICDPGWELVRDCIDRGIEVTVLPGACACVTALVLSGLSTAEFVFEGFIPVEKKQRRAFFEGLLREKRTAVFYEAPHKLVRSLEELDALLSEAGQSDRRFAAMRELTKTHEEALRGSVAELLAHFRETAPRGEFVLCLEGVGETAAEADRPEPDAEEIGRAYSALLSEGRTPKDALKEITARYGISRNIAYKLIKVEGSGIIPAASTPDGRGQSSKGLA